MGFRPNVIQGKSCLMKRHLGKRCLMKCCLGKSQSGKGAFGELPGTSKTLPSVLE
jgi:hypothetical protein